MDKNFIKILIVFLFVQSFLIFAVIPADENVYYYAAKLISDGKIPYKDFFFGHPPLQIFLYAIIIKMFGVHIWVLKLFTVFITVAIGYLTYVIAKERYNKDVAVISSLLFFTSYDGLLFGSYAFGIEIAVLFFLLSFYYSDKKPLVSGVMFALCVMTRLHLAPLFIILLWISKNRIRFMAGCCAAIPYFSFLWLVPNFVNGVFLYHYAKGYHIGGWLSYLNVSAYLIVLFLYSFRRLKDANLIDAMIIYLGFMAMFGSVFEYYFLVITVILCIEGANTLCYSRYKMLFLMMVCFIVGMMCFNMAVFFLNETREYNKFIGYVKGIDGSIMGQPAINSLLALKTGKQITRDMVDLNFQRREEFDYSNSTVIYESKMFIDDKNNCKLISKRKVGLTNYSIFDC